MKPYLILFLVVLSVISCDRATVIPQPEIFGLWRYTSGISTDHEDLFPAGYLQISSDYTFSGYDSNQSFEGSITENKNTGSVEFNFTDENHLGSTPWATSFISKLRSANFSEYSETSLIFQQDSGEALVFERVSTCLPAINDRSKYQDATSDPFQILELHQISNCLEIVVSYAGGCKEVDFVLVGSGDYAESYPPQLQVRLLLDDQDDCEAQIIEFYYFDVTELQYPDTKELIFHLDGFDLPFKFQYDL